MGTAGQGLYGNKLPTVHGEEEIMCYDEHETFGETMWQRMLREADERREWRKRMRRNIDCALCLFAGFILLALWLWP